MSTRKIYGAAAVSPQLRAGGAPALTTVGLSIDYGYIGAGGSNARRILGTDGRQWVMKSNILGGQTHRYLCLNESVAAQIAMQIGLNVPEAAVIELDDLQLDALRPGTPTTDRFFFGSQLVEPAEVLSPSSAAGADSDQLAGIAVFDALIWNTDPKPEHILVQQRHDGDWDVFPIDHGHVLAIADFIEGHLPVDAPAQPPFDLIRPFVTNEAAEPWFDMLEGLRRSDLIAMARGLPAAWIPEPDAPERIADALVTRAGKLLLAARSTACVRLGSRGWLWATTRLCASSKTSSETSRRTSACYSRPRSRIPGSSSARTSRVIQSIALENYWITSLQPS